MIKLDGSIVIQIVNFIFLIWVLNLILYKPLRNILRVRHQKVSGLETEIDALGLQAGQKDEVLSSAVRSARMEGLSRKTELLKAAEEEEKKIIREINESSQMQIESLRLKIVSETDDVKAALMREIDVYAKAIGRKILGRTVS
jgi:F-type H+-transporting ATPase subunit b